MAKIEKMPPFDKYDYYLRSVQDPLASCDFLEGIYRDLSGKEPLFLREDFGGTFALSYEWVRRSSKHVAAAVDNDKVPLAYGKKRFLHQLVGDEKKRIFPLLADVRSTKLPKADVICALNFSYGVIKDRTVLKDYLKKCLTKLRPKGILVMDCLGGMEIASQIETTSECEGFTYTWEQESFDPLSREARFSIHFQRPGEKQRRSEFIYEWRMWTPIELRDLMLEVGFKNTFVYCESNEEAQAWVAYVVGLK